MPSKVAEATLEMAWHKERSTLDYSPTADFIGFFPFPERT